MKLSRIVVLAHVASAWIDDATLKQRSMSRRAVAPGRYVVNLDAAPKDRWNFLKGKEFANFKADLLNYLDSNVPKWTVPVLAGIAKSLESTFYPDYAAEMRGIAAALNLSVGEVVLINLIYQVEGIHNSNCTESNTTGPCLPPAHRPRRAGPGLCTGVVAAVSGSGSEVWHGRNMDWNLDAALLKYVMQVDYKRSNSTVLTGLQIVGMVGTLHGLRQGGFAAQMNARDKGGNALANLLDQIATGAKEPSHVMRKALEEEPNFSSAEARLSRERLANPVYYIMSGSERHQGTILTRDRRGPVDSWHLYEHSAKHTNVTNAQPDWLRLQTNYDHWEAAPSWDDRRTPGVANVQRLCKEKVDSNCMLQVMTTWPTKNHHTDITSIMCPKTGYFSSTLWMEPSKPVIMV